MRISAATGRRWFLRSTTATAVAALTGVRTSAGWSATPGGAGPIVRPEDFGARGDGRTDDTAAFQKLGSAVSAGGGGTVILRRGAVYRVGRQGPLDLSAPARQPAFAEQPMLLLRNVDGLVIQGNGAVLKLNDGLRYGSFDPATGQPFAPPDTGKFTDRRYAATVGKLIEIQDSTNIRISGLVLDGNVDRLLVGGRWGDVEIQLAATGLQLTRVSEAAVQDVISRNNGLDGIYIYGRNTAMAGGKPDNIVLRDVRAQRNGRQGMSVVGGNTLRFEQCVFADTAQGPVASRPRAGVDIEPNGQNWTTNLTFEDCQFVNNRGVGLLADAGNSSGITARGCTFWQGFNPLPGMTVGSGDAFWLKKDDVLIDSCQVHGSVSNLAATAEVRRTSFDNAVHPTLGRAAQRRAYLLDQAGGTFIGCAFTVSGAVSTGLMFCKRPIAFRSCQMRFAATGLSAGRPIALFSATSSLTNVTFSEGTNLSKDARFIYGGNAQLRGKVFVTGPSIRWNSRNGPIGNITARSGG